MKMNIFLTLFVIIVVPSIAVSAVFAAIARKNSDNILENLEKEHVVVRQPTAYIWIGTASLVTWLFCLIIIWLDPPWSVGGTWWVQMVFWFLAAFSAWFLLQSTLWRLDIYRSKDYFEHKLFRKRMIYYDEVEYYCDHEWLGALYVKLHGNNKMLIDPFSTNLEIFTIMLSQKKVPRCRSRSKHIKDNRDNNQ